MTLDETIKRTEELVELNEDQARVYKEQGDTMGYWSYEECAKEYQQFAKWLKELKYYKDRQDLINKSWQELINYKEGIEKIKMRSQVYRERGENILASGMEQALDILQEVNADEDND